MKRTFPKIDYQMIDGKRFDNNSFKGKKTMVVLFYIGCPAAMTLTKDLNHFVQMMDTATYQVIGVMANTKKELLNFQRDSSSQWNSIKQYYKLERINFPIVAECSQKDLEKGKRKEHEASVRCRKLAKKFWSKSTPTIIIVDEKGKIKKRKLGYFIKSSKGEARMNYLYELLNS